MSRTLERGAPVSVRRRIAPDLKMGRHNLPACRLTTRPDRISTRGVAAVSMNLSQCRSRLGRRARARGLLARIRPSTKPGLDTAASATAAGRGASQLTRPPTEETTPSVLRLVHTADVHLGARH